MDRVRISCRAGVLLFGFLGAGAAIAAPTTTTAHGFVITVEPIVGYEYTQRDTPSVHRKGMLIYGARFTAGRPHVSVEGEYTRGNDTEVFTSPSASTVSTTRENVRLGVRGTYDLAQALAVLARLGGQATKASVSQVDSGGLTTSADRDWTIHPYAGAGLQLNPVPYFSIGVDATYVFNSLSDYTQNTIQLAGSIRIHLPTK